MDENWLDIRYRIKSTDVNPPDDLKNYYQQKLQPIFLDLKQAITNNKAHIRIDSNDGGESPVVVTENSVLRDELQERIVLWLASLPENPAPLA